MNDLKDHTMSKYISVIGVRVRIRRSPCSAIPPLLSSPNLTVLIRLRSRPTHLHKALFSEQVPQATKQTTTRHNPIESDTGLKPTKPTGPNPNATVPGVITTQPLMWQIAL